MADGDADGFEIKAIFAVVFLAKSMMSGLALAGSASRIASKATLRTIADGSFRRSLTHWVL